MSKDKFSATLDVLQERGYIDTDVPSYIKENLTEKFDLRYYQEEAISRFVYYLDEEKKKNQPDYLLYHMSTGSGKTVIHASNIIELYKRGYRNFVFFVNSKDIIEKTKENLLNASSSKYLFNTNGIKINGENVNVKSVENFSATSPNSINIHFTTIQGLHSSLNQPKENSLTYEEFKGKDIVFLADESHHLNAETKTESQKRKNDKKELTAWEDTVQKLLYQNKDNILIEYTATANLDNENIFDKYKDKIIYQYSLKQYRKDKFSKEVNVLKTDLDPLERAFQAMVLSQYRRKIAEEYNISDFKPVVLMKSSSISDSKKYKEEFIDKISQLSEDELREIKSKSSGTTKEAFEYFESKNISYSNLAREFQQEFSKEKIISVDSKNESEEKQLLVNSLEERNNNIRVIFAVDKLNEGWDVLNLFDIVRLYDTSTSTSGPSKTTVGEAQLIGRGARYYPFKREKDQDKFKRKFDDDLDNPLRILEELYYHSPHNPQYIEDLKTALVDEGIFAPEGSKKEVKLNVKDSFKQSDFWKRGKLYSNEKQKKDNRNIGTLEEVGASGTYSYKLRTGVSDGINIFEEQTKNKIEETKTKKYQLIDMGVNVIRKSMQRNGFYHYSNLSTFLSNIDSVVEFIESSKYLGSVFVEVTGDEKQIEDLTQEQKLSIVDSVLNDIEEKIRKNSVKKKGSKEFYPEEISKIIKDKTRRLTLEDSSNAEEGRAMSESKNPELQMDLSKKEWYVYDENYGTTQEKYLLKFIDDAMNSLKDEYEDVYLVRNESLFRIHRFSDGRSMEPDFVLFLNDGDASIYQLFVEPKGEHLMENDEWKEDFLKEIKEKAKIETVYQDENIKLVGLPFYNESMKQKFESKLSDVLDIEKLY